eukprot:Rmarinus@m.5794
MASTVRLFSWNVNGLRALENKLSVGGLKQFLGKHSIDILCLQETKMGEDQIDDKFACVPGYEGYFSCSRNKKGYSGVATYVNKHPKAAEEGFCGGLASATEVDPGCVPGGSIVGDAEVVNQLLREFSEAQRNAFDSEGRCVVTDHDSFVLFNVYFPNGGRGEERLNFKLDYYRAFALRLHSLVSAGRHVIVVGDVNTCHHEIDVHDPKSASKCSGFLPIERAWLDSILVSKSLHTGETNSGNVTSPSKTESPKTAGKEMNGRDTEKDGASSSKGCDKAECASGSLPWGNPFLVDTFRYFHPEQADAFSWWDVKTGKRKENKGWRLDYIMVNEEFLPNIVSSKIETQVFGSDHCPVSTEIKTMLCDAEKPPSLAARNLPHIAAKRKQTSLFSFFTKGGTTNSVAGKNKENKDCGDARTPPLKKART